MIKGKEKKSVSLGCQAWLGQYPTQSPNPRTACVVENMTNVTLQACYEGLDYCDADAHRKDYSKAKTTSTTPP